MLLQSLYALPEFVRCYLDKDNAEWIDTDCNKKLRNFFAGYKKAYGPYDPLPFIMDTLAFGEDAEGEYNVFHDHDPYETMRKLFNGLLHSQRDVAAKKAPQHPEVRDSDTLLGRMITSLIQTKSKVLCCHSWLETCEKCGTEEWTLQETQTFSVPADILSEESQEDRKEPPIASGGKYIKAYVDDTEFYVPRNVRFVSPSGFSPSHVGTQKRRELDAICGNQTGRACGGTMREVRDGREETGGKIRAVASRPAVCEAGAGSGTDAVTDVAAADTVAGRVDHR